MSDSLWPHGLQHARPPCPSPTPRVYSNSCPLSWWCHPTISSSVIPFSSCFLSFPASGFFQMSQLFPSGGQSIRVSASTSVLPMNIQDWFPLGWTGWISLLSKGSWVVKRLLQHHNSKASIFQCSTFFMVQLSHPHMTTGKTIALTRWTFVDKVLYIIFYYIYLNIIHTHTHTHTHTPNKLFLRRNTQSPNKIPTIFCTLTFVIKKIDFFLPWCISIFKIFSCMLLD